MKRLPRVRPEAPRKRRPAGPWRRLPPSFLLALIGLVCFLLIATWLIPVKRGSIGVGDTQRAQLADGSTWTVGMLRPDGLRLIVSGRNDAADVLAPEQFSRPAVRQGYQIATRIPEVLNKLYCWCGCENRGVHRSNLQCFEDKMAQDCPVCLGTAEMAYDLTNKGVTDAATIQAAVDARWAPKR